MTQKRRFSFQKSVYFSERLEEKAEEKGTKTYKWNHGVCTFVRLPLFARHCDRRFLRASHVAGAPSPEQGNTTVNPLLFWQIFRSLPVWSHYEYAARNTLLRVSCFGTLRTSAGCIPRSRTVGYRVHTNSALLNLLDPLKLSHKVAVATYTPTHLV